MNPPYIQGGFFVVIVTGEILNVSICLHFLHFLRIFLNNSGVHNAIYPQPDLPDAFSCRMRQ